MRSSSYLLSAATQVAVYWTYLLGISFAFDQSVTESVCCASALNTCFVCFCFFADDRPRTGPVISKPISSEPSKSASPSPPPPLIAETEPVLQADVTLVPPESPVAVDTTEEPPEAPTATLESIGATTTVPGGPVQAEEAPALDTEPLEEAAASPILEPPPQPEMPTEEEVTPMETGTPQQEAPPQPEELPVTLPGAPPTPPPSLEGASEEFVESNGMLEEETPEPLAETHLCQPDSGMESPLAEPEESAIPNGLGLPEKQEAEELEEQPESDISPISEPEEVKVEALVAPLAASSAEVEEPEPEEESEEPAEVHEASAQQAAAAAPAESMETTMHGEHENAQCTHGATQLPP